MMRKIYHRPLGIWLALIALALVIARNAWLLTQPGEHLAHVLVTLPLSVAAIAGLLRRRMWALWLCWSLGAMGLFNSIELWQEQRIGESAFVFVKLCIVLVDGVTRNRSYLDDRLVPPR